MVKCSEGCTPCCDFCIYALHEAVEDEELGGTLYGGPIWCDLWKDDEHQRICESCGFCEDFHCYRAETEKKKPTEKRRAKRRHIDFKKAIRKQNISKHVYWWPSFSNGEWYDNLHQYSKNKIHCSCPMCRQKTNNKGSKYGPRNNWPQQDLKRLADMKEQEVEQENDRETERSDNES